MNEQTFPAIKIETAAIKIECADCDELKAIIESITSNRGLFFPANATARAPREPATVPAGEPQSGDESEERELRDKYRNEVGNGFSMKGKAGRAIDHLRVWKAAFDSGGTYTPETSEANEPRESIDLETVPT